MRIRIDEPGDARSQSVSFSGPVGHAVEFDSPVLELYPTNIRLTKGRSDIVTVHWDNHPKKRNEPTRARRVLHRARAPAACARSVG
jgi:hypothetical protein